MGDRMRGAKFTKLAVKYLKIVAIVSPILIILFGVLGYMAPFRDREGRCPVCGMRILEKNSSWLSEPIIYTRETPLSRFYYRQELPEHEHPWEYMGGTMLTNLYGYPAEYEFEPSDPLLLVPDQYIIEVLRRLEVSEAQIEFLRALNCDDEYIRETVRAELYASYPGGIGSLSRWWEEFITDRGGIVPSSVLPGPPWDARLLESDDEPGGADGEDDDQD